MTLFGKKDDVKPEVVREQFHDAPTSTVEAVVEPTQEPQKAITPHVYAKIPLLLIREPIKSDTDQLYELGKAIPELASKEEDIWLSKTDIDHYISYNASDCLVAELEGKIIGFILTQKEGWEHACIVFIGVHPDYRKSGIGKYLMTQIESKLQHVDDFYLFATSKNAVSYFEKFGYAQGKTMTYMRKKRKT